MHNYHVDIKAKEDEITKITENEIGRYEREMSEMQHRHHDRETTLLNQLAILEEEGSLLQTRLQKDRERSE